MSESLKKIVLYTDGACTGNPGPGGYGIVLLFQQHRKEISGGYRLTTNNRMEMMGVIIGLQALKERCDVTIYTDSQYIVESIEKGWVSRWQANNWMRNKKDKAVNPDLWAEILSLCKKHKVKFNWVRGHAGNIENERCDQLAVSATKLKDLPIDSYYEESLKIREIPSNAPGLFE